MTTGTISPKETPLRKIQRFYCPAHKRYFRGREWNGHRRHCQAAEEPVVGKVDEIDRLIKNLRSSLAMYEEDIAKETGRISEAKEIIRSCEVKINDLKSARDGLLKSLSKLVK